MLLDHNPHPHAVVGREGVGHELDVVDRKIVVAPLLQIGRDALALAVEHRDVENPPRSHQRIGRVGGQNLFEELVAELIRNRVDQIGRPLPHAVGHLGPPAARKGVDLERRPRREEPLGIHVDLQILGALLRQVHVEQHRLLADSALPLVPFVGLRRVGLLVEPHVEIGPQKPFVGGLPHVLFQVGRRNPLLAGRRTVLLDGHFLQEIFPLGDMARDAACRANDAQHHSCPYATRLVHPR